VRQQHAADPSLGACLAFDGLPASLHGKISQLWREYTGRLKQLRRRWAQLIHIGRLSFMETIVTRGVPNHQLGEAVPFQCRLLQHGMQLAQVADLPQVTAFLDAARELPAAVEAAVVKEWLLGGVAAGTRATALVQWVESQAAEGASMEANHAPPDLPAVITLEAAQRWAPHARSQILGTR
jgi:hypothetical protein